MSSESSQSEAEFDYTIHYAGAQIPVTAATAGGVVKAAIAAFNDGLYRHVTIAGEAGSVFMTLGAGIPLLISAPPGVDMLAPSTGGH